MADETGAGPDTSFPQRQVTLVIGFPPGGGADTLARLFAKHMGEELGKSVIVDYRPGAAGNIGAKVVARSQPDGYTVYLGGRANTIHKAMYPSLDYDFSRDFGSDWTRCNDAFCHRSQQGLALGKCAGHYRTRESLSRGADLRIRRGQYQRPSPVCHVSAGNWYRYRACALSGQRAGICRRHGRTGGHALCTVACCVASYCRGESSRYRRHVSPAAIETYRTHQPFWRLASLIWRWMRGMA